MSTTLKDTEAMDIRPNIVLAVVTAAIVALALTAAILSLRQPASAGDPSTPQGVVQSYAKAVVEQNYATAVALLDPSLQCTRGHFLTSYVPGNTALMLLETTDTTDPASVTVEISSYGDALAGSTSHQEVFELRPFEETWRITGAPWPVYDCGMLP